MSSVGTANLYDWIVRLNSNPLPLNDEEKMIVTKCNYLKYIRKQSERDNFTPKCVFTQEHFCDDDCICNTNLPSLTTVNNQYNFNVWFSRVFNKKELSPYEWSIVKQCPYLTDVRDHMSFNNFSPQSMMTVFRLRCDSSCICNNLPPKMME